MVSGILYTVAAYVLWYFISRLSLLAAWLYSKPGTTTARHYLLILVSALPLAFELVSTVLIIFAVGFGISPRTQKEYT